jgi:hypothetical protein
MTFQEALRLLLPGWREKKLSAADTDTVVKNYARLIREHHPDMGKPGNPKALEALQQAKRFLMDRIIKNANRPRRRLPPTGAKPRWISKR